MYSKHSSQSGMALLSTMIIVTFMLLSVFTMATINLKESKQTVVYEDSTKAFQAAQGGIEDALLKVKQMGATCTDYETPSPVTLNDVSYDLTITCLPGNKASIRVIGKTNQVQREISMEVDLPALPPPPGGTVIALAGGNSNSLALKSDGTVWAWGGSGAPPPTQVLGPGGVGYLTNIIAIATGSGHSLAVKNDGTVWAWGSNIWGQLGDGTTTWRTTPVQVKGPGGVGYLTNITDVSAGNGHSLALKSDGTVWGWGHSSHGQVGNGSLADFNTPQQVEISNSVYLTGITAIQAEFANSLALKNDGTVWAWGYNYDGQIGDGTTQNRRRAVQVKGPGGVGYLTNIIAISGRVSGSIALKSDGTVWNWGNGEYGQLGIGSTSGSLTPVQVKGPGGVGYLTNIVSLYRGENLGVHSIVKKSDGTAWAWGANTSGRLGDGTNTHRYTPVQVVDSGGAPFNNILAIVLGSAHSLAIKNDNTAWGWGDNQYGQLGDGTTTDRWTPVQVSGL